MGRQSRNLPARLERIQRRFERWRQTHRARSRFSERLWSAAAKVAGIYGICRTARALRVSYYSLKERVEQECSIAAMPDGGVTAATFLELAPPSLVGPGECTLELEDAGGAKMRVHLKGFAAPDLAALSRSFWSPAP